MNCSTFPHMQEGCSVEEIVAVLAHELGHWKLSHNLKNICVAEVRPWLACSVFFLVCVHTHSTSPPPLPHTQVNFFLIFFMFGYFVHQQDVYTSFGFPSSRPTIIGLILVFQLIFIPYFEVWVATLSRTALKTRKWYMLLHRSLGF